MNHPPQKTTRCHWPSILLLAVAVAVCIGAAACGKAAVTQTGHTRDSVDAGHAEDVPSDAPGPDKSLQDFSFATTGALCTKMFECCTATERKEKLGLNADTVDQCAGQAGFFGFAFGYGQLDESIKEGRIVIDEAMAQLCLGALADTDCADFSRSASIDASTPGCSDVFQPQVADNGFCQVDQDCKSGFCSQDDGADTSTCHALPKDGQDCSMMRCADGLYCDTFEFVCVPVHPDGEPCPDDTACASQHCAPGDDNNLICQPRPVLCSGG